uniref:Uncharacterized protein n=1 Tax=Anguilla anguilla TaxID=7936 RepID=A0A0E9QC07_ANGAN
MCSATFFFCSIVNLPECFSDSKFVLASLGMM